MQNQGTTPDPLIGQQYTIPAIHQMFHRKVLSIPLTPDMATVIDTEEVKCADCGAEPKYLIIELEDLKKCDEQPEHTDAWLWCGVCEIGG